MVAAFQPFDFAILPSLAFLFGIAAQFRAMGGNSLLEKILGTLEGRIGMVYAVFVVAGLFSPFILNDVVILILTPVIVKFAKETGADVAPLLVAEITMVNVASSLTPLGNPQNILLWTAAGASFAEFVSGTFVPVALSSAIVAVALFAIRKSTRGHTNTTPSQISVAPAIYLVAVGVAILLSDLVGVPSVASLAIGFALGFAFTFRSLKSVVRGFDIRSLLTLYLFVGSIAAVCIILGPVLLQYVAPVGNGTQPYSAEFFGVVSNFISNVPATQLVLSLSHISPAVASESAVSAGFAGNISPLASFANILALQIARKEGLPLKKTIALQFVVGVLSFVPAFL